MCPSVTLIVWNGFVMNQVMKMLNEYMPASGNSMEMKMNLWCWNSRLQRKLSRCNDAILFHSSLFFHQLLRCDQFRFISFGLSRCRSMCWCWWFTEFSISDVSSWFFSIISTLNLFYNGLSLSMMMAIVLK